MEESFQHFWVSKQLKKILKQPLKKSKSKGKKKIIKNQLNLILGGNFQCHTQEFRGGTAITANGSCLA